HHVGGVRLGGVDAGDHVGVDVADVDSDDLDTSGPELQSHGVGGAPHGGLGYAVGAAHREPGDDRGDADEDAGMQCETVGAGGGAAVARPAACRNESSDYVHTTIRWERRRGQATAPN